MPGADARNARKRTERTAKYEAMLDGRHREHWVYRCFDAAGSLLYIGMTVTPLGRIRVWRSGNVNRPHYGAWFTQVTRIDWQRYPDWHSAHAAEVRAIEDENPPHNVKHRKAVA